MIGIAAVLTNFTLYVLTHWAVCRWGHWRPHGRAINILWVCFLPVFGAAFYLYGGEVRTGLGKVDLANGLLLNVLLLLGYTYFFFLVERGLSLRVMIEIGRAGKMTIPDIQRVYTYDYIIDKRLEQMKRMGYAKLDGERITGTVKSAKLAAANALVRKILRLEQMMP